MEVLDPAAVVEVGDCRGIAGDLLVGGEQLAAIDGIGAGGVELACGDIADLPFGAHAADTDDTGGCGPGKGICDSADGRTGSGDCTSGGAVGTQCDSSGVAGDSPGAQRHSLGCTGSYDGAITQGDRACVVGL